MTEEDKQGSVTLGGKDFPVLPTLLRDVEKMTPMLRPLSLALRGGVLIEEDMRNLVDFVYLGLKRGTEGLTADALRDLPVNLDELLKAFEAIVSRGLRLQPKAAPEGEAPGETPKS